MKSTHSFVASILLLSTATTLLAQGNPPPGFKPLFNGKDLTGWYGMGDKHVLKGKLADEEREKLREESQADIRQHWKVENEELINDGHGLYLTTQKDYEDFELLIDYKTVAKADSGIYLRTSPQVQIWDYTKEGGKWNIGADKGSGGLWNNSPGNGKDPLVLADKPFGEWNHFRIIHVGARTTIYLNDKLVVDHAILENLAAQKKLPQWRKGPIMLQTHGGEIRWRNIFIKEIGAEEANSFLRQKSGSGFTSLFNGKDLTGWSGATANYEVKNGAIVCKPGKGGQLFTQDEFGNFVARLEFKLPPGGNNGLAIRYPGSGDPAYAGFCELQVLDNEDPKYKTLDARQYHGSAYGLLAAHRGYLRPTGEWNYQEVTVQGTKVKVELNGTIILEGDLSQVKEFMANTPHPGLTRTSGHFGFAGHGDAVEFRKVEIKKL